MAPSISFLQKWDTNNDGQIELSEVNAAFNAGLSVTKVQQLYAAYQNGTKFPTKSSSSGSSGQFTIALSTLQKWDTNNDGQIEMSEVQAAFNANAGVTITQKLYRAHELGVRFPATSASSVNVVTYQVTSGINTAKATLELTNPNPFNVNVDINLVEDNNTVKTVTKHIGPSGNITTSYTFKFNVPAGQSESKNVCMNPVSTSWTLT